MTWRVPRRQLAISRGASMYDTRSLADVSAGEQVEVRELFFDTVRSRFEPYGIRAGVTVRCVERGPAALTIVTPAGTRVDVRRDDARFVEVSPL